MKIVHISDLHIRNYRYHDVYKEIQEEFIKDIEDKDVDYIFVTGDIAHTKTNLSPDYFDFAVQFFNSISEVADTKVFIGNHDANISNKNRQDAVSPVIDAIDDDSIEFFKNSRKVSLSSDVDLYHLSIFDKDWERFDPDSDKTNIATFHGKVAGAETDMGWVMKDGEIQFDELEKYDYALLGDIHKSNQILDEEGRVRYAGSFAQQNYGEDNDKGYLEWDIYSREDFNCSHNVIENPRPFCTVSVPVEDYSEIPQDARVRVKGEGSGFKEVQEEVDSIRKKCSPYSVSYVLNGQSNTSSTKISSGTQLDLRNLSVQEDLLREYYEDDLEEDVIDKIVEYNEEYADRIELSERFRNIDWSLKELQWDNLFNFGEENSIDFSSKSGILGIFGENYSGKSSIIDSLLYTLFNSTSKNFRKNLYAINQDSEKGSGKVTIEFDGDEYHVERESEKYIRRLHGEESEEARTSNSFYKVSDGEEVDLEADTRRKTDKEIRKRFGTLSDFKITSFTSQFGSLEYISKGSTKRKEILAKFLDLEQFDKKYNLATDDLKELRADLKKYEGSSLDEEEESLREELSECESTSEILEEEVQELEDDLSECQQEIDDLQDKIDSVPADPINIESVQSNLESVEQERAELRSERDQYKESLSEYRDQITQIEEKMGEIDYDRLLEREERYEIYVDKKESIEVELDKLQEEHEEVKEYASYIENPPCDAPCSECTLLQEAHEKVKRLEPLEEEIEEYRDELGDIYNKISSYSIDHIQDNIERYESLDEDLYEKEAAADKCELSLEKVKNKLDDIEDEYEELSNKKEEYEENKEAIENLDRLISEREERTARRENIEDSLNSKREELKSKYKESGFIEQKIENIQEEKEELSDLRFKYEALEKFREAMHSNGIPFEIIKNNLERVNKEISDIIGDYYDFEIFFKHDDGDLEIFIAHPDQTPRPIELGSGAEKIVAAISIRLALLNITSMPKGDVFILDEPAAELDPENMQAFVDILQLIKSNFRVVVLISHLESLKDCADEIITIDEDEEGYAHVES